VKIDRIADAMDACRNHLDATGARNTEVESFLVGFLLVMICSEYEIAIKAMVSKRAEKCGDGDVHGFVREHIGKIVRGIKVSDLTGVVGSFSSAAKEHFQKAVINQQPHVSYDNIMTNRHSVAHRSGSQVTFSELEGFIKESDKVLDAAAEALGLDAADLAALA
jgi:hypothetical protein